MSDFNFVGAAYQAPSAYQNAQECINWYPEVDPTKTEGERGITSLYPTPGLLLKVQLGLSAEVRALYVVPSGSTMIAVVGNIVYTVNAAFSAAQIGTLQTSAGRVFIADNNIGVMLVDGPNRYTYNLTTQAFTTLSAADGGFTGGDAVYYVDDYLVYNRPGTNQWGCTSPLTLTSPALSFSSKDSTSDNIVTIITDHRQVYLLGERTAEVWINTGTFPFPFQRIPGTSIQHGCAAKNSVSRLGESIAWLSQDGRGQAVVIQLAGYSPTRISTHAVESDIATGPISDAIAYTYQQGGHEFYVLTLPNQDKTWVYDLATRLWHKRAYRDSLNKLHRHRSNVFAIFNGLCLVGDYQNGCIYALDQKTYTDNGMPILRMRRCAHLTAELKRIYHKSLQIQFQPGVGLTTGQGSSPQMMLRWSNDGGSTYTDYFPVAIGGTGMYRNRAIKRRLGQARDRVYEVTITDPVYAVIISAEIETEESDS